MIAACAAFEEAVNHSHRGTRIAAWVVLVCASLLVVLILR